MIGEVVQTGVVLARRLPFETLTHPVGADQRHFQLTIRQRTRESVLFQRHVADQLQPLGDRSAVEDRGPRDVGPDSTRRVGVSSGPPAGT